ncbi:MAG: DUF1116 domain-containing protein [Alphaproteobacteria bacterium]|nr:DUF1116 domain-containing protein [Alphaproteobacteria bacterium]
MPHSSAATEKSYEQLIAVVPTLTRIAPLKSLMPLLPDAILLHAGPPFADQEDLPAPVRNALFAAAEHEGLVANGSDVMALIADGRVMLRPAQDFGVVTPLAFVVGPSMYCLEVRDAKAPGLARFSPLNDGPMPNALRLGAVRPEGLALLRRITASIGGELAEGFEGPVPLLPILNTALGNGDDLHGQVAAAQGLVAALFTKPLSSESSQYLASANQFALNVIMAACALMIGAGAGAESAGITDSEMVIACGGNGLQLGYQIASRPGAWITLPANPPRGPKFPGKDDAVALPAIGDSAVIDALGFGAACLRLSPSLAEAYAGHVHEDYYSDSAHAPFVGPHPGFDDQSIRMGLDLTRPRSCLGINLGMVERSGTHGLIGRGVSPWPDAV